MTDTEWGRAYLQGLRKVPEQSGLGRTLKETGQTPTVSLEPHLQGCCALCLWGLES